MAWAFLVGALILTWVIWQNSNTSPHRKSGSGQRNEVKVLLALALRKNPLLQISNDYEADRVATIWITERPPQFLHDSIGENTLQTSAIGEAFFLLASRLGRNLDQPHVLYEEGAITYLLALSQTEHFAGKMTALDWECLRDAACALNDARAGRENR